MIFASITHLPLLTLGRYAMMRLFFSALYAIFSLRDFDYASLPRAAAAADIDAALRPADATPRVMMPALPRIIERAID